VSRISARDIIAELPPLPDAPADEGMDGPPGLPDFDLGELASRGVQPPQLICSGMLYSGGVHCVAGQPGGGKTTLAAWWMLQHIRDGGAVMLLDEESGPEVMAEKLLDIGATPDELRPPRFSYCPFPARGWNLADVGQLHERLTERHPGIVVFDSAVEFLTLADLDENSSTDVTRFWKRVLKPCARQYGAAVVVIDHTGKGAEHGGYGRGSGGKKGASDVLYIVETIRPFNRAQDGLLRLTTSPGKDRRGHLPVSYDVHVRCGPPLGLEIAETTGDGRGRAGPEMPPAKAKLLEALTAISTPAQPVTVAQLVDWIVKEHGHGLKRPTVSTFLNQLAKEGLADATEPPAGKPKLWFPAAALPAEPPPDGTRYLARRDPHAPEVRPPCQHEGCFDALLGRCLQAGEWPADSLGAEAAR